jgi:hypothetical protein
MEIPTVDNHKIRQTTFMIFVANITTPKLPDILKT